jgi:uncharacterized protein (TIGR02611 family)
VSRPEIVRRWARWRESFRHRRVVNFTYRIVVGVVGLVIFAFGIVAIPYPGPGWAIVIVGRASWPPSSTGRGTGCRLRASATTR